MNSTHCLSFLDVKKEEIFEQISKSVANLVSKSPKICDTDAIGNL